MVYVHPVPHPQDHLSRATEEGGEQQLKVSWMLCLLRWIGEVSVAVSGVRMGGLVYGVIGMRSEIGWVWVWVLLRGLRGLLATAFVMYVTGPHNRPTCRLYSR